MQRMRRKSMIGRKEKESHQQTRDCNGRTDLQHALGFVVFGGEQFVVKKAIKDVAYKDLELALLTLDGDGFGLHCQRENRMFGGSEETDLITHDEPP
jgi:hypothetical protein